MSFSSPYGSSPSGYQPMKNIPGYSSRQLPTMNRQQNDLLQQLLTSIGPGASQGLDYLSKLSSGDEGTFEDIERPAYSAFNKFMGSTANRFSQYGARDSSAFRNAINSGAADLSESIASNRSNLQQQAIQALLNQSNTLLSQRPFENLLVEKKQNNSGNIFGNILGQSLPIILKGLLGA